MSRFSDEHRKKLSESHKGQVPWNKGRINVYSEETLKAMSIASSSRVVSEETKRKTSVAMKGKRPKNFEFFWKRSVDSRKGRPLSEEHKRAIGLASLGEKNAMKRPEVKAKISGEKSNFWRGGKMKDYPELVILRKSLEYREWREKVYVRDNYTCQFCEKRGGRLNADHIKPFAIYPELRFNIENGRTLCEPCHHKTETYGGHGRRLLTV